MTTPNYLSEFTELWQRDPHAANLAWFAEARYGLFLHYGLYSQLGRHEWVMRNERYPVADYEKLADSFDPSGFDAEAITDLACAGGMRYVNLVTCHHEGFCLWDSATEPFNSLRYAGRDLVRELGAACDRKGLGFFVYYTHMLNWRHPYALTPDLLTTGRAIPDDPRYVLTRPEEWRLYWDYAQACIEELCRLDCPVAGVWLDLITPAYEIPELIPIDETYAKIHAANPAALIAYKQGATGTEDFASPEFHFASIGDRLRAEGKPEAAARADRAWQANAGKHNEICMTLQHRTWGYQPTRPWKTADELWGSLAYAHTHNCNLLANIGPQADGAIPAEGADLVRAVGERLRLHGWPGPADAIVPEPGGGGAAAV